MIQKSHAAQPLYIRYTSKSLANTDMPALKSFSLSNTTSCFKRIAVKTTDATHLIRMEDILHCRADNNYCTIFYGAGLKVLVAKTLKAVGDILPATTFLRVHNSHIVRIDAIHLVYPDHLVLDNGNAIPISRSCRKDLSARLSVNAISL